MNDRAYPLGSDSASIYSPLITGMGTYDDGPLDREQCGRLTSVYRAASGRPFRAAAGDRRVVYGRWQPGETGIYTQCALGYKWMPRLASPEASTP
jgi:hypothetical protein